MKFVDLDAQFATFDTEMRAAIDRVIEHKQFIMGPEVAALEEELSTYCGADHVISAASGTVALLMALMVHGVGPGDGIIAPPFTFVATAEVIQLLGATTVFVDVMGWPSQSGDPIMLDLMFVDLENNLAEIEGEIVYSRIFDSGVYQNGIHFRGSHPENITFAQKLIRAYHYRKSELVLILGTQT